MAYHIVASNGIRSHAAFLFAGGRLRPLPALLSRGDSLLAGGPMRPYAAFSNRRHRFRHRHSLQSLFTTWLPGGWRGTERGHAIRRGAFAGRRARLPRRSEEHTSELQSLRHLVCRLLLDKQIRSEEHTSELQSLRHLVCRLLLDKNR